MRNFRNAGDAKGTGTLSFSAQLSGSLAFVTSTASGTAFVSAAAPAAKPGASKPKAARKAASLRLSMLHKRQIRSAHGTAQPRGPARRRVATPYHGAERRSPRRAGPRNPRAEKPYTTPRIWLAQARIASYA